MTPGPWVGSAMCVGLGLGFGLGWCYANALTILRFKR